MTNRFLDSFDHYNNLDYKWDESQNATISSTTGRYGTAGADLSFAGTVYIQKNFTDYPTGLAIGVAVYRTGVPDGGDLITVLDTIGGTYRQVGLFLDYNGNLGVSSSGSTLFTTTKIIQPNSWYYVELLTDISLTGSASVYVNGNTWGSGTGVTQSTGSGWGNAVRFNGVGRPYLDDIYINDTSGSLNNTVWGDVRVEAVYPDNDGFWQQWDLSTGSLGWDIVSNNPPDLGQYLSTGSLAVKSTFLMSSLSAGTGTIKSVQQLRLAEKTDITVRETRNVLRLPSGAEYVGETNAMTEDPEYYQTIWQIRPDNVAWNETTLDETQFGFEAVS